MSSLSKQGCLSFLFVLVLSKTSLSSSFAIPRPSSSSTVRFSSKTDVTSNSAVTNIGDDDISARSSDAAAALEERDFLSTCKQLCLERNLPLQKVKNARDLASVAHSPVKAGRIFRTGRVSDATDEDIALLFDQLQIQTLVDLRSPTELKDDPTLQRPQVFSNFTDIVWKDQGRNKDGCLRELKKGEFPVKKPFWKRTPYGPAGGSEEDHDLEIPSDDELETDDIEAAALANSPEEFCFECGEEGSMPASKVLASYTPRKERHFVSVMNEFKYVKGTVSKVRKRDITKSILKAPGAVFSKRVRSSLKKPFLDEINGGGLPMLNSILLRFGAPGIRYVLELVADRNRHPIAFYCTAGKDRTGIIAAIILSLCSVPEEDIVQDYSLSANVYAEMNDHKAMVGALSQRNLDAKTFLGAPPEVMRDTLQAIQENYGSVAGYCEWIGFGPEKQDKLRKACMDD